MLCIKYIEFDIYHYCVYLIIPSFFVFFFLWRLRLRENNSSKINSMWTLCVLSGRFSIFLFHVCFCPSNSSSYVINMHSFCFSSKEANIIILHHIYHDRITSFDWFNVSPKFIYCFFFFFHFYFVAKNRVEKIIFIVLES